MARAQSKLVLSIMKDSQKGEFLVERYSTHPNGLSEPSSHPDRLRVSQGTEILLDISMSSDSPMRAFLSATHRRPWFFTGSPFGEEILNFARQCGVGTFIEPTN